MIFMDRKVKYVILFLSLVPVFSEQLFSQEVSLISPYLELQYFKNTDDQRILKTTLTYSKNRMEIALPGIEVSFVNNGHIIATVLTDDKGIASLELKSDMNLKTDRDGIWSFSSEFKGNDTIEAGTAEISIKDVMVEMVLSEIDSIKTVNVKAFVIENGTEKPVSGEVINVYVPRMFSLLPITELTLDDAGSASAEFPEDLPGDIDGNLTIIAKFDENMIFGNVEKRETLKWGLPTHYSVPVSHRALWTKTAPRWMIITLSILLTGVWGHYLFAIISLIRIKKNAKKEEKNDEGLFIE
jgi:hypothetical protein